jgi:hypothetical protein
MRFTWIFSGLLLAFVLNAQAEPATTCVPQAEMQAIAQHFTQFKNLANQDYCYDGSHESHLIAGLMFMRETKFAASMPKSTDDLFSGKFANDWYQYFIGRINDISIQKSCEKGVAAYVFMFGNTMYVCPMLLSDNFTALDRASVMMHEARHIDGFPHVTCTRGARKGMRGACDNKIADGGSYAVTVETYSQIAAYAPDIHPALKAYARAAGITYADETFEMPTRLQRQTRFLMLSTQGEFRALDLNNGVKETSLGQSPALGRIAMRAQHMVLYPEDRTQPAKYVFARSEGDIQQAAGDMAVDYNSETPQQRSDWVDVHVAAQWSAKVLKTKVTMACDPKSDKKTDVTTGSETPASLIYPNGYDRENVSAHIAMQSGKIFEVGCAGTAPFLRPSTLAFDQSYKRIYKAGNDVVGLTKDGRLFRINGATSTPIQTSLDGRVYELAPNQSVSFLDMN